MKKEEIIGILQEGGVGILPTDTLYGIVGSALREKTVARVFHIKKRNPKKPPIILLGSQRQLRFFGIHPDHHTQTILSHVWPGSVSVILPCARKKFFYLHKGKNTLAFRVPAKKNLRALLKKTGPLIAPSANPEGLPPARTIGAAKKYFGESVDFYIGGKVHKKPSTLVALEKGALRILRKGAMHKGKIKI